MGIMDFIAFKRLKQTQKITLQFITIILIIYMFCTSIQNLQHNISLCKQHWTEASVTKKKNMKTTARAILENG